MPNRNHKITLEFETAEKALEWFDAARAAGHVPAGCDLFKADALELERGGDARTYTVRPVDTRDADQALRAKNR